MITEKGKRLSFSSYWSKGVVTLKMVRTNPRLFYAPLVGL
jgi:hypothetical protein